MCEILVFEEYEMYGVLRFPMDYLSSCVFTESSMMQEIEILRLSYCRTPAFEMGEPGPPNLVHGEPFAPSTNT